MDYQFLGIIAGIFTTIAFVPQVYQSWKSRSAEGLSLGMLIIFNSGVLLWLIYGILEEDIPIILTNAVVIVLSLILLGFKLFLKPPNS